MRWDYANRLQASSQQIVSSGLPEITYYVYDTNGDRVRKVTEHSATAGQTPTRLKETIYLDGFDVYRRYQHDGVINRERTTLHVKDHDESIALIDNASGEKHGLAIRYQYTNHLGSVSLELGQDGQLLSYEEYTPYGATSYFFAKIPKRYRFTGKERDKESGLYYYGARYYAPGIARWISCDPIGLADGVNLYLYVHSNPVNYIDPTGTGTTPKKNAKKKGATKGVSKTKKVKRKTAFKGKKGFIPLKGKGVAKVAAKIKKKKNTPDMMFAHMKAHASGVFPPGTPKQWHHLLPKTATMEPFFRKYGFNVHEATYGVMLPVNVHQKGIHSSSENWNAVWQRWVDSTEADIKSGVIKGTKKQVNDKVQGLIKTQLKNMKKAYFLTNHEKATLSYTDYKK